MTIKKLINVLDLMHCILIKELIWILIYIAIYKEAVVQMFFFRKSFFKTIIHAKSYYYNIIRSILLLLFLSLQLSSTCVCFPHQNASKGWNSIKILLLFASNVLPRENSTVTHTKINVYECVIQIEVIILHKNE